MGATFKQAAKSIREAVLELIGHHHDDQYDKKGSAIGENLLINPNYVVSQRGDYSTATTVTTNFTHFVDKFYVLYDVVTVEITHKPYDTDMLAKPVRLEVTSGGTGYFTHSQTLKVKDEFPSQYYDGEFLTFTMLAKSNFNVGLAVTIDGNLNNAFYSNKHTGNGEKETLTVTFKVENGGFNDIVLHLTNYDNGATSLSIGDYFEAGRCKLDLGAEFTGFETVDEDLNWLKCRQYGRKLGGMHGAYSTTTNFVVPVDVVGMINESPFITILNGTNGVNRPNVASYNISAASYNSTTGYLNITTNSALAFAPGTLTTGALFLDGG